MYWEGENQHSNATVADFDNDEEFLVLYGDDTEEHCVIYDLTLLTDENDTRPYNFLDDTCEVPYSAKTEECG